MAQQLKVLASKPDELSATPEAHTEEEKQLPQGVLCFWMKKLINHTYSSSWKYTVKIIFLSGDGSAHL